MGKARKPSTKNNKVDDRDTFASDDNNNDDDEIDTFYAERDENLRTALAKTTKKKSSNNKKSVSWALDNDDDDANGRDEVLAFDDDDDDDESFATDDDENEYQEIAGGGEDEEIGEEGDEIDEDLRGAWGTSRKAFYNEDANVDDEDAKLEEQEAVQIQKKYYDMLEKTDFGLDLFKPKTSNLSTDPNLDADTLRHHIILPDNILQLSSNDRLQLIRDQSPELELLCQEFKNIFDDLKIYLLPFIQLVIDTSSIEEFQTYSGWQFILSILELYLTYCSYLSLYLMMKSNDLNLGKHPILNDIEQYRQLCQVVNDDFQLIKNDLLKLCEFLQERKQNHQQKQIIKPHLIVNNKISLPIKTINGITSKPSLRERMTKRRKEQQQKQKQAIIGEENEMNEDKQSEKRAITYEIKKNKGLTIKRKKEYKNPRVRNRNKYERALTKRKSRVPTARTENEKYTGEPTGIRAGIKRGIKLKV